MTNVLLEKKGHIAVATINRPKALNALNSQVLEDIDQLVEQVKADDEITLRTRSQEIEHFKALREGTGRVVPKWLSLDAENLKAKVVALPVREDIDVSLQEHLIVELYSK